MGLGVVPETWLAEGPFGPGSAQRWVDEDIEADPTAPPRARELDSGRSPFSTMVCNNADRKPGHVLTDKEGRLWAIDHGLHPSIRPLRCAPCSGVSRGSAPPTDGAGAPAAVHRDRR